MCWRYVKNGLASVVGEHTMSVIALHFNKKVQSLILRLLVADLYRTTSFFDEAPAQEA